MATTRAPAATATPIAASPTPPQPCTATHSPARTSATSVTARNAVATRQPSAAARTAGSSPRAPPSGEGREVDEIDVGVVEGHELGEGAPSGEAGLGLVPADLLVARAALAGRCRRR